MNAVPQKQAPDFSSARANMIESQLRPNKIRDERILTAMETLPRELFVPPMLAGIAYIDEDLQVAPGRYLLEPMILARLLQDANIGPQDRVLDIAPATGYSTAVIAALAKEVVAVESDPTLQTQTVQNLSAQKIGNFNVKLGVMTEGCKDGAPYDVIVINGCVDTVPDALLQQLADGGRLVTVVRRYGPAQAAHIGEARLFEKIHGSVSSRPLFDANVKILPGFEAAKIFVF